MDDLEQKKWGRSSLLASEDERIRQNLRRRYLLVQSLRAHLRSEGFVEVDTPILRYYEDPTDNPQFVTLGPLGWPRLHLRTCPEEYTRRCACTFGKVFEIGKCFRNERIPESDSQRIHLPEFTIAEIYEVDTDLEGALCRIESTVRQTVQNVHETQLVLYQERMLDFSKPFLRLKVLDALTEFGDADAMQFAAKHQAAKPQLIPGEDVILHNLLDRHVKPRLIQPTFLTHFPKSADQYPDRVIGNEVQRAEFVAACIEIGEVGELQPDASLLHAHAKMSVKDRHGDTAVDHLVDIDYMTEIKAFNRQVGGGAIGFDRLLMLLCDTIDVRDVVWYPLVGRFHEGII